MAKKKIVRKKIVKKVSKQKVVKKSVKVGKVTASRKDFEVFAKGVERLEELGVELNGLDTIGYESDVAVIRGKLKNVSYIPQIEKEIRALKSKIGGTYKASSTKVVTRPVVDEKVTKKIRELEKEVSKKRKAPKSKELMKIPKLESQINYLKGVVRKQQDLEKRKQELLKKIDPGVNFLIDNQFNLSLNEIKAELSKKIKSKESEVQKQLQDDLESRKKNFQLQYKDLQNKFSQKYEHNVQEHLANEVKKRFNDALRVRVNALQKKLEREAVEKFNVTNAELNAKEQKKLKQLAQERASLKKKLGLEGAKKLAAEEKRLKALLNSQALKELERKTDELKRIDAQKIKELEQRTEALKRKEISDTKKLSQQKNIISKGLSRQKNRAVKRAIGQKNKAIRKSNEKTSRTIKKLTEKRMEMIKRLNEHARKSLANEKQRLKDNERRVFVDLIKRQEKLKSLITGEKQKEIKVNEKTLKVSISRNQIGQLRKKLEKEFMDNKNNLEREYGAKLIRERTALEKHFKDQILAHRVKVNNQMHEHLTSEVKKLHREYGVRKKQANVRVEAMKRQVDSEKSMIDRIKNQLNVEKRRVRQDKDSYKQILQERLEAEKQEAIKNTVREQSAMIKSQLRKEFNEKLNLEIRAKAAEFEKKKADLALEIQRRAKSLFV